MEQPSHPRNLEHRPWWTYDNTIKLFQSLPEDITWNCIICVWILVAIVFVAIDLPYPAIDLQDLAYNIVYAVHVLGIAYCLYVNSNVVKPDLWDKLSFVIDIVSYVHIIKTPYQRRIKLSCYYLRLHRAYSYLFNLNDFNLTGSVLATTLKYCYITLVLRVIWALTCIHLNEIGQHYNPDVAVGESDRALFDAQRSYYHAMTNLDLEAYSVNKMNASVLFLTSLYIVNKMVIPIGISVELTNDLERIVCLCVMITGCLVVNGAAVASLSLVISIYMRSEEAFRSRFGLIIKEMKDTHIPKKLQHKVDTFYKMYWNKQRAVSESKILSTFPPTLPATIYTDIYFEMSQKSRILQDLSIHFLSEISKKMATTHFIPGDTIIKRSSNKSSIIYITYGDVEMLTAEDDLTPMLRMARGTILSPYGLCAGAASARAHVEIRAATYCIAHVFTASDLWRIALKHGHNKGEVDMILEVFGEHIEKVKRHYNTRIRQEVKYKSSILNFKRNLLALKEERDEKGNLLLDRPDVNLEVAGTYILRNFPRAEGSLAYESDAICLRPTFPCILQPSSSLLVVWNCFVSCIIVAVTLVHPYYLVFRKDVTMKFLFFNFVVTVIYVLDIIAYLSTGANVEEGVAISFEQTASQQIRSYWFVLDVIGTAPIFEFIGDGSFAGINKILRLPKVFRVLKSFEDICVYHSNIIRFLSYTLMLLIACYLIAALQQGFMCFHLKYCQVSNFTHPPYWDRKPLNEETVNNRVGFGLFWAMSMITFTTHMETWSTDNINNVIYTMNVLEICIILHIFIEAVYSATIMVTTAMREDYDAFISYVKDFLTKTHMDTVLQQRFISYLQLCWYTDKAYSMTHKKISIYHDLPSHVYQDIVVRQRSKYILCIPFMKLLHHEELRNVSSNARMFHTSPNEILLNTGDISNEMYVIIHGTCEVVCPDTKMQIRYLGTKSHFGVLECLLRIPAYYTVRAVTHLKVFSVSRKHILQALKIPQIKDAIEFAKSQHEYSRLQNQRQPFISYEPPKPAPNMEKFKLPKKYEADNEFLDPFMNIGFFSILRYVFPRSTIRPDGTYLVRYEWFRAACALLSSLIYPGYAYLRIQWQLLGILTTLLDFSAYYDIFQRMLVGYFNKQGILVYHPSNTAAHYMKGPFLVDLFGCLPLELLEINRIENIPNMYHVSLTKQVLMLNRILQLYRLPNAMTLTEYIDRRDIVLVIKGIPLFMVLVSVLTSILVFFSVDVYYSDVNEWLIVPKNDPGGSWIHLFGNTFRFNVTATPWNLHLAAYFWVVYTTTTTGYNSIGPTNFDIMQLLFWAMVIGSMMTTYFSVRIISIRANVNSSLATYQEHFKDMIGFMKREKLDQDLQKKVLKYYEHNWDKMAGIDYRKLLKLCDQVTLRIDATLNLHGSVFSRCPILSTSDISLLRSIGRAVSSHHFLKQTVLVTKNDVTSDIYFIDYGKVLIREEEEGSDKCSVIKLSKGSVFGNLSGSPAFRSPVTIVTLKEVHLLHIKAQLFNNIISDYPAVRALIDNYCPKNESYIRGHQSETVLESARRSTSSSSLLSRRQRRFVKFIIFESLATKVYFILISLTCIYADVYNAGFQNNSTGLIITLYLLDLGFCLKPLFKYLVPKFFFGDASNHFMMKEAKRYLANEFKFEILSCIPLEVISLSCSADIMWMVFSYLRLNRMFRIVPIYKYLYQHKERVTQNLMMMTTISVLVWLSLFIHSMTSLWFFIGTVEDKRSPNSSWLHKDDGTGICNNLYICSLYFILTTFTQNGVGDVMPKMQSEVFFVSIFQVISTMVYMVFIGEFSNVLQFKSFRLFSYYYKYLELQDFLKNNKVSKNLVLFVNKYCLHFWREKRGEQMPYFLVNAPFCMRLNLISAAFIHHLNNHPVFGRCEPEFLRQLVLCFELYTYIEDMYVVKEYDITDSMYMIHTGRVLETSENQEGNGTIYLMGQSFGELQGFVRGTPFRHSYKTIIKSQVLTLNANNWDYLLNHFPASSEVINDHFERPKGEKMQTAKDAESVKSDDYLVFFKTSDAIKNPLKEVFTAIKRKTASLQPLQKSSDYDIKKQLKSDNISTNHIDQISLHKIQNLSKNKLKSVSENMEYPEDDKKGDTIIHTPNSTQNSQFSMNQLDDSDISQHDSAMMRQLSNVSNVFLLKTQKDIDLKKSDEGDLKLSSATGDIKKVVSKKDIHMHATSDFKISANSGAPDTVEEYIIKSEEDKRRSFIRRNISFTNIKSQKQLNKVHYKNDEQPSTSKQNKSLTPPKEDYKDVDIPIETISEHATGNIEVPLQIITLEKLETEEPRDVEILLQKTSLENIIIQQSGNVEIPLQIRSIEKLKIEEYGDVEIPLQIETSEKLKIEESGKVEIPLQYESSKKLKIEKSGQVEIPLQIESTEKLKIEKSGKVEIPLQIEPLEKVKIEESGKVEIPLQIISSEILKPEEPDNVEIPSQNEILEKLKTEKPNNLKNPFEIMSSENFKTEDPGIIEIPLQINSMENLRIEQSGNIDIARQIESSQKLQTEEPDNVALKTDEQPDLNASTLNRGNDSSQGEHSSKKIYEKKNKNK